MPPVGSGAETAGGAFLVCAFGHRKHECSRRPIKLYNKLDTYIEIILTITAQNMNKDIQIVKYRNLDTNLRYTTRIYEQRKYVDF